MKLSVVIPVVETENTRRANAGLELARRVLSPETELRVSYIEKGFESLESLCRVAHNAPGILQAVKDAENAGSEGVLISCMADPALPAARELAGVPVVGAFRSAMLGALCCAERISIIIPGPPSDTGNRLLDDVIGRSPECKASIVHRGFTNLDVLELHDREKLLARLAEFAQQAANQYRAGCLVLGCTNMSYILPDLRAKLRECACPIQIVEPLSTGLKLLESYVSLGLNSGLRQGGEGAPGKCPPE